MPSTESNNFTRGDVAAAYSRIGLDFGAKEFFVKKQYRKLSRVKHPDKGGSTESFQQLNADNELIQKYLSKPADFAMAANDFVGKRVRVFGSSMYPYLNGYAGTAIATRVMPGGEVFVDVRLDRPATANGRLIWFLTPESLQVVSDFSPHAFVGKLVKLVNLTTVGVVHFNGCAAVAMGVQMVGGVHLHVSVTLITLPPNVSSRQYTFPTSNLSILSLPSAEQLVGFRVKICEMPERSAHLIGLTGWVISHHKKGDQAFVVVALENVVVAQSISAEARHVTVVPGAFREYSADKPPPPPPAAAPSAQPQPLQFFCRVKAPYNVGVNPVQLQTYFTYIGRITGMEQIQGVDGCFFITMADPASVARILSRNIHQIGHLEVVVDVNKNQSPDQIRADMAADQIRADVAAIRAVVADQVAHAAKLKGRYAEVVGCIDQLAKYNGSIAKAALTTTRFHGEVYLTVELLHDLHGPSQGTRFSLRPQNLIHRHHVEEYKSACASLQLPPMSVGHEAQWDAATAYMNFHKPAMKQISKQRALQMQYDYDIIALWWEDWTQFVGWTEITKDPPPGKASRSSFGQSDPPAQSFSSKSGVRKHAKPKQTRNRADFCDALTYDSLAAKQKKLVDEKWALKKQLEGMKSALAKVEGNLDTNGEEMRKVFIFI